MSADNVIKLRPPPLDLLTERAPEPFASTVASTAVAVIAPSTAVALTVPSTIQVDALVPLGQPLPDPMQLVWDHWTRPQLRKAIAALLALYPNGPPIGPGKKKLVTAVIKFCEDPERSSWMPPPCPRTISDAIGIIWPWLRRR